MSQGEQSYGRCADEVVVVVTPLQLVELVGWRGGLVLLGPRVGDRRRCRQTLVVTGWRMARNCCMAVRR
jgi:hypothetical protein